MKKYLIGLGCSWTQGEGGYPDHIWEQHNYRMQLPLDSDYFLRKYEHENSWVNVLCRDYFTEFTPVNLGVRGIGSRAAVHQLHFCDKIDWDNSTGIIIFMIPGMFRYDILSKDCKKSFKNQDDFYSNLEYQHYKWTQVYPNTHRASEDSLYRSLDETLLNIDFISTNQVLALLELQNFCKLYKYKLILVNPYNVQVHGLANYLHSSSKLAHKIDWSIDFHKTVNYVSLMQKLVSLEFSVTNDNWHSYFGYYNQLSRPAKYLTNCAGTHPTIDGYKVIAKELADYIMMKNYV